MRGDSLFTYLRGCDKLVRSFSLRYPLYFATHPSSPRNPQLLAPLPVIFRHPPEFPSQPPPSPPHPSGVVPLIPTCQVPDGCTGHGPPLLTAQPAPARPPQHSARPPLTVSAAGRLPQITRPASPRQPASRSLNDSPGPATCMPWAPLPLSASHSQGVVAVLYKRTAVPRYDTTRPDLAFSRRSPRVSRCDAGHVV